MRTLQYKVHTVDTVKSTNTTVKALASDGAPEGYVLVAASQTNGRGRLNRVFFSPKETGLYVSILLRPECPLPPYALTCMAAVALNETIAYFGISNQIKWVNDIYINGKKAAGILVESVLNQDGSFASSVVGIGVNLFYPKEGFPDAISETATAVFSDSPSDERRKQFLKRLLLCIKKYYEQLPEISFFESYREKLVGIGQRVLVSESDGMRYGTSIGLDRSFRLIVRYDDGTEAALDRGDVTFV
ncbi:MAG: biotin--[Clostridia bacterium]|nr:biotin--[acetyl-CoA-carboxylase] ligase [Clostridia bacterium]